MLSDKINCTPANCPELVKFVRDIKVASPRGKPLETHNTPKEKATGKYPNAIGILFFIPFIISFMFHHHEYHSTNRT